MGRLVNALLPPELEPNRFLRWALLRIRWATIAILLLITFMQPAVGHLAVPTWTVVLIFAAYNALIELLRERLSWLRPYARVALLDLPVVGLLYWLGAEPGGPLFLLVFLAVDCAAVSLALRGALLYTVGGAALAAAIDVTTLMWSPTPVDVRQLIARSSMLALVGLGMAIVTRRLALEGAAASAGRDEAERLAALDRLRADFIATVSHDLRTPLTAARAGLGLLEASTTGRLSEDERELLDTSRRNVEYLTILIGDLLTYNQLEAGTLHLAHEALDLREVVATAVRVVGPLFREKDQTLALDLPHPLPYEGDPQRLGQALVNLLANAHRHTLRGTHIVVSGHTATAEVALAVSDDGPGIPPEELEAIFRRFYRYHSAATPPEAADSSGLGLAIARRIVELHGGRLWAESAPGRGATFRIALPRDGNGPDAAHQSPPTADEMG